MSGLDAAQLRIVFDQQLRGSVPDRLPQGVQVERHGPLLLFFGGEGGGFVDYRDLGVKHLKPLMPLRPVLQELHALKLRLGVATNDTAASAVLHMRALDAADLFDIILGADSVARPKPSGDMIHAFADAIGIGASEVAMVGDNPHDMETAHDAGAGLAIGVLSGNSAHDHLAPLADHVIDSISELPALLRKLG